MADQDNNTRLNGAIARYRGVVDGQIESVEELETWLRERGASNRIYQDIASSVYPLSASNKARLLEARRTGVWQQPPASASWGTVTWSRTSAAAIAVTGLGLDAQQSLELHAQNGDIDSVEQFVSLLANAFANLAATEGHIAQLAQAIGDMEAAAISGSPGKIVHDHIRLLGQYNEAKDIAQQLIGLIADNRGVPVGSLYQGDRYGVGTND